MKNVTVEYVAEDPVADADRLANCVQREIEKHLRSIPEVGVSDWDLRVEIVACEMRANHGEVQVALSGSINSMPVEHSIRVGDRPDWRALTGRGYANRRTSTAFANLFTFLGRLILPSGLVVALGNRRTSGRLVRAWSDCFREIRICIDDFVQRPDSGSKAQWRATWVSATLSGLIAFVISAAAYWIRRGRVEDDFRAQLSCIFLGVGVYGVIASCGLLLLPSRFFQSEKAGLRLVQLVGVKSLAGIRAVAVGLLLFCLLFLVAPGIYWLFFE